MCNPYNVFNMITKNTITDNKIMFFVVTKKEKKNI